MTPLDHKLLRDLWRVKGQAIAIAVVIALGVLMLVMMDGLINSLTETKRTYYERYRFAEVFAPVKRAPEHLLDNIAKIPGVAAVAGRINAGALINLPGIAVPVRAQAVSLPDFAPPRLNDLYLSAGRRLDPARPDEILLLEGFAKVHGLSPGDKLSATMSGAKRTFQIVGLAQAPEFLYSTPPGELMPDDARFAVIWMGEHSLAAAYDLKGAFNEALLTLTRDARLPEVLDQLDRMLASYGGLGAYGVDDHFSDRFVSEEIKGLAMSSKGVPPIFLGVAAFLLYIVISRMVESEREQIGLLKAFGYSSGEVGAHYFKFIMAIAISGALLGCLLGVLAGRSLSSVYQEYYKFPFLVFQVDPAAFLTGVAVSVLAASVGGVFVLRKVFALTPATAMRPPAPADYSRSVGIGKTLKAVLDQPSRIVVRGLIRQPGRALAAVVGISAGMALSVAMISLMSGFDRVLDMNFGVIERSDVTVSFVEPLLDKTVYELQRMEGVIEVEPFRSISATLRHGLYTYRGGIRGLVAEPRLNRAVDDQMQAIYVRADGIILAKSLADILHIQPGETLTVEVREGRRPVLQVPVVGVAQALLGAPTYMQIGTLNQALKEQNRVSGAYLRIDSARSAAIYHKLKDMPAVAGVSLREESRAAFKKVMDTGAGAIRYVMAAIAGIITFGIVYNSARITFAERSRDLASLRVIGLTTGETGFILLGELGIITLLALPLGSLLGYYLSMAVSVAFSTDLYSIPAIFVPESYGVAALAVLGASAISGWLVKRDVDRLDLVSALKTRE
ncbi:FtsX-like permease family protein [Thiothrix litoralis]|uniref:FtsX-like permease family protein n=1 Tax=Thiothrix litoralis TaxID=2891210 RepID=A0ABX7WTE8_9GAMM|nr:ABC transporter permease [Thiothrix litoralis]QTR46512.1 FtsX-like permease family protein [Thiothrix litoralis]